jgi:hypothetical protein
MSKRMLTGLLVSLFTLLALGFEWLHHHVWPGIPVPGLPLWLAGCLPSLFLALALSSAWRVLLPQSQSLWIPATLLVLGEILQAFSWPAAATFDPLDVLAILLATLLVSRLPLQRLACSHQRWSLLLLPALLGSQLACYTEPTPCVDDDKNCSTPIFLTYNDIRAEIVPEYGNTAALQIPGKLYQMDNWLGVVDQYRGLHIFDVTDKQNPLRVVYLPIPGITDLSVKNDYLYINAYVDLVTISLADLRNGTFDVDSVHRLLNSLAYTTPEYFYDNAYFTTTDKHKIDSTGYFLIGYVDPWGDTWLYGQRHDSHLEVVETAEVLP